MGYLPPGGGVVRAFRAMLVWLACAVSGVHVGGGHSEAEVVVVLAVVGPAITWAIPFYFGEDEAILTNEVVAGIGSYPAYQGILQVWKSPPPGLPRTG